MASGVRHYWMDLLNVIACFAVVLLHCSTSVFLNTGDTRWVLDVVYQSVCVFAVPVFFMVSGANLLGYRKKYDTKTFFVKRFKKVVSTLCVASAIVYVARPLVGFYAAGQPIRISLGGFVDGLLHNSICDVYWFFYAILVLYLVTPIFSLIADNKRMMQYALVLSIVATMVIPLANRFTSSGNLFNLFSVSYLDGWIVYYLLGYYLQRHCSFKASAVLLVTVSVASCVAIAALTLNANFEHTVLSGSYSPYDNFYANAENLLSLVYASSLFLLFKSLNERIGNLRFYGAIKAMSGLSLGVYAIHMLVISSLDWFVPHRILWDLGLRPIVVFAVSLALSWAGVRLMALLRRCVAAAKRQ